MSIPSNGLTPAHPSSGPAAAAEPDPVAWIVRAACQKHPGLTWELAQQLAAAAWEQAQQHGEDAPEIARQILAQDAGADASATAVVAAAAVEYVHAARSGSPSA